MQASGVKAQELNMDIDPVGVLFGEEELTKLSNKKPFLMQVNTPQVLIQNKWQRHTGFEKRALYISWRGTHCTQPVYASDGDY